MMDYEFELRTLRAEANHLREMQVLASARHDVTDSCLRLIEGLLRENSRQLVTLTANVNTLTDDVKTLVAALLREHPNGHGKAGE